MSGGGSGGDGSGTGGSDKGGQNGSLKPSGNGYAPSQAGNGNIPGSRRGSKIPGSKSGSRAGSRAGSVIIQLDTPADPNGSVEPPAKDAVIDVQDGGQDAVIDMQGDGTQPPPGEGGTEDTGKEGEKKDAEGKEGETKEVKTQTLLFCLFVCLLMYFDLSIVLDKIPDLMYSFRDWNMWSLGLHFTVADPGRDATDTRPPQF